MNSPTYFGNQNVAKWGNHLSLGVLRLK